jgi:uncharacterized membrane protein
MRTETNEDSRFHNTENSNVRGLLNLLYCYTRLPQLQYLLPISPAFQDISLSHTLLLRFHFFLYYVCFIFYYALISSAV